MIGAIVGDIVSSRYNVANERPSGEFKLFDQWCHPTEVTNVTLAVGEALIEYREKGGSLSDWVAKKFAEWGLKNRETSQVSFCGWAAKSYCEALDLARGVDKGSEEIAALVFLARHGIGKEKLREYMMSRGAMTPAISAFFESDSFVEAIRKAVVLDCDRGTHAAITGAIAEAYYGVFEDVREVALEYLGERQRNALLRCEKNLFCGHITGGGWDSLDADGSLIASGDPEFLQEMGLIPTLQELVGTYG